MKDTRNIYRIPREAAGITQERAAELLFTSVESLRAYETDKRTPPDDIVVRMIEIYGGCQYLAYQHLKTTAASASVLPDVERKPLAEAALTLLKELNDVDGVSKAIIEIACDNEVSDDQRAEWAHITKELNEACGAILTILCADTKRRSP